MLLQVSKEKIDNFEKLNKYTGVIDKLKSLSAYKSINNYDFIDFSLIDSFADLILAQRFTKNPNQQGIFQKEQEKLVDRFCVFHNLKWSRHNRLCFVEGKIHKKSKFEINNVPDIDYTCENISGKVEYVFFNKHITGKGGSQNAEFAKTADFVSSCCSNITGIILVSGSFWNNSKINKIKNLIDAKKANCFIFNNDSLKDYLDDEEK